MYLSLVNVSGASQAGASGAISGRKLMGGDPMALLSGNIIETSGGTYRANLYDWDTSGNQIGYFFSASGCLPIMINVVTIDSTSGKLWIASGPNVVVPPASISGAFANSGLFVSVPTASLSGVVPASGLYLASGSFFRNTFASGVLAASGGLPTAWGNSGQVFSASGANAVVPISSISGLSIASGTTVGVYSGNLSGQQVNLLSGNVVAVLSGGIIADILSGTVFLASGQAVYVYSGQLSGQQVTLTSGMSYTASGINVTATATVASGALYLASGSLFRNTFASGVLAASGGIPTAWGNSGQVFSASGANVVVPIASISGTEVVATVTVASGSLYLASGSLFRNTFASGVLAASGGLTTAWGNSGQSLPASGANVTVPIASISGTEVVATATIASGSLYLASGSLFRNTFASGVLAASGGIPTAWGNSGQVMSASGANSTVPVSSISGVNAVVPIANISGTSVVLPSASISGVNAIVPTATLSGVVPASGAFVVANSGLFASVPAATLSGITLASGNIVAVLSGTLVTPWSGRVFLASGTGTSAIVDSGSIAQIATTLLTVDVSGAIELNAAKQSLGTMVLKQTSRFDSLASGLTSGMAVTYFCDGTTVKIMQPVVTTLSGRPIRELGVGQ